MIQSSKSVKYGFNIWWDSDDSFVGKVVAEDNYEPFESDLFLNFILPDSVVIDVGANIGYYSLLAAKKLDAKRGGVLFAFEPEQRNFELLEKNIDLNRVETVVPMNQAIALENGSMDLFLSKTNKGDHQLYFSPERERQTVKTVSLDGFIHERSIHPTVLKVDTQGYDFLILKSAAKYIQSVEHLVLFTEFWDYGNRHADLNSKEYFDFLQDSFKEVLYIDEEKQKTYPVDFDFMLKVCEKYNNYGHGNLLCIK